MSSVSLSTDQPEAVASACPSCGAALAGEFCHRCGERNPAAEDRSLRYFLREAAEEVTSLDSTVFRTLRLLFTRPGALTEEYLRGRRRLYVGPLRLYLVVFALLMVIGAMVPNRMENGSAADRFGDAKIQALAGRIAQARSMAPREARQELNRRATQAMSWFSVGVPLIFALALQAVFARRRRWFAEHLVFATHFATFNYVMGIPQLLATRLGETGFTVASVVILPLMVAYLYAALRRVYPGGRLGTAVRTVVLLVGLSVAQLVTAVLALGASTVALLYF